MIWVGYLKLPNFCLLEELEMQHGGFSDAVQPQGMKCYILWGTCTLRWMGKLYLHFKVISYAVLDLLVVVNWNMIFMGHSHGTISGREISGSLPKVAHHLTETSASCWSGNICCSY